MIPYVARWDLDKTYLRTEFDTLKDIWRTALEAPNQKRTVPGASSLLREIASTGAAIHILSGSPEQMRSRIEQKLTLDGARWDSLTLKPNLRNILRLRFRAVKDQLGYKLPALLAARASFVGDNHDENCNVPEVLIGDDAESDAFVYSLYADILAGSVSDETLERIMRRARAYEDTLGETLRLSRLVPKSPVVGRILIHLDRQSPPSDFDPFGQRVVPFFNYLQAALVLHEDEKLRGTSVIRVATEFILDHRFDGQSLVSSYLDLTRRGHLTGKRAADLQKAYDELSSTGPLPGAPELLRMCIRIQQIAEDGTRPQAPSPRIDYVSLAERHSRRQHPGLI